MELHNNHNKLGLQKKLKRKLTKKLFVILLIVLGLGVFGFSSIIYGAYLNSTSQTSVLKMFLIRVSKADFSFLPEYFKSKAAHIETLTLDIKFKDWERIRFMREAVIKNGGFVGSDGESEVPGKIRYGDHTYKVKIGLTGMTSEHVRHPSKWSLSVKVKGGETIMGMKKFALLFTQSRGYLTDWIATKLVQSKGVVGIRTDFVNVEINGKNHGVYYLEERFDKRLIENNKYREGIVFRVDDYGSGIKVYGLKKVKESEQLSAQLIKLKKMWFLFLQGELEPERLIDLKKFATIYVVSDIMNQKHALFFMNMRLYFNPITGLIEPIGREWGYLRPSTNTGQSLSIGRPLTHGQVALRENTTHNQIMNSELFEEEYIKQLNQLTNFHYLDSVIEANSKELEALLGKIHIQNPFYKFPIELLYKNQKILRSKIYPDTPMIKVYFDSISKHKVFFDIKNKIDLPIEIHAITYNYKELTLDKRLILKAGYKVKEQNQSIYALLASEIDLDHFSLDSLSISYSILGMMQKKSTIVFSKLLSKNEILALNPPHRDANFKDFSFIKFDPIKKIIRFTEGYHSVNKEIIIPKGYTITADPGLSLDLLNSSRIITYSPISFSGTNNHLIEVFSSDSTGQGIVVFNCEQTSELSYVKFNKLSNITDVGWGLTGAVTFYNSSVSINHCSFSNNLRGDDFLNIVRSRFVIKNTIFENTNSDALDADFCDGTIQNVQFINSGNDAIDVSGTELFIVDVKIVNSGDKAISGGEGSHLVCNQIIINGGEIAVASKDNTSIEIDGISIDSSKLAYCVYQKKSEYGPGTIVSNNSLLEKVGNRYLVEVGSFLSINGSPIEDKSDKVKKMLYGAEYGKSSN